MRHRAAISAALFGALAGSGALPITPPELRGGDPQHRQGRPASLAAFADAFDCATRSQDDDADGRRGPAGSRGARHPPAETPLPGDALAARIGALPHRVAEFARAGAAQVAAYQDTAYARGISSG